MHALATQVIAGILNFIALFVLFFIIVPVAYIVTIFFLDFQEGKVLLASLRLPPS